MKETLLLTKHMRDFPENSHNIEVYEKNNGYSALKKVLKIFLMLKYCIQFSINSNKYNLHK